MLEKFGSGYDSRPGQKAGNKEMLMTMARKKERKVGLGFRFNPDMLEATVTAAGLNGETVSEYLRRIVRERVLADLANWEEAVET